MDRTPENRELYDIRHASRRVNRSRRTVYYWMRHGLTFQLIGGRRYIAHEDLLAMYRGRSIARNQQRATGRTGKFRETI